MSPEVATFRRLNVADNIALCIYGEAEGEPVEGQVAVGWVIRNRVERRGSSYLAEIFKPKQFSCFNDGAARRGVLLKAAEDILLGRNLSASLRQCRHIADGVIRGVLLDNTKGADHYMTLNLFRSAPPSWADPDKITKVIGQHIFFRLEG